MKIKKKQALSALLSSTAKKSEKRPDPLSKATFRDFRQADSRQRQSAKK